MTTRERNQPFPIDAPIRRHMPAETLCRSCLHAPDVCDGIRKTGRIEHGRQLWVSCAGYEEMR